MYVTIIKDGACYSDGFVVHYPKMEQTLYAGEAARDLIKSGHAVPATYGDKLIKAFNDSTLGVL